MDLRLKGKVALVMAAGGGLGSAIAEVLSEEGVSIAVADINFEAAQRVAKSISDRGAKAKAFYCDLKELNQLELVVSQVQDSLGQIDILVNNTGGPPPTAAVGVSGSLWSDSFSAMVLSVIRLADAVLPGMQSRGWGRIITSSSSGVIAPIPGLILSNSLRSSLVTWSKTLAREVAPFGVTVNVTVPGRIGTDRIRHLDESRAQRENKTAAEVEDESRKSIPMHRYGLPREYADAVAFLASARASYITGSVIRVDGGLIPTV
ncbi:SDR family oxidoreductase [Bradyrhizobium mercantei]|uniref:SDR family oxidoreductase n=1 Tax=Bradyrhizobium mercantei TaxID=1904807 RepID=UPI0009768F47|nr:SDR family oxidoreductase [Bradyrhizobium mercantei]